jgi:galactokinase/mevalonate kinase-like predicted kinase
MSPSRSKTVLKSIVRGDLDASGQRHWRIKRKIESEVSNCVARASIECVSTQAQSVDASASGRKLTFHSACQRIF